MSPVLAIISSMCVPICNRFYAGRANTGKMKTFRGYPSFAPLLERNPFTQRHEISSQKTRVFDAAHSEDFVILACTVLIQITSATDRQTDGQTPRLWLRRTKHSAVACNYSQKRRS